MIDIIVKLAGSLLVGGLGLALVFLFMVLITVLSVEIVSKFKKRSESWDE
jgi:Na+-transporting methylmalonyl-CoA/oxaloacetate decarboxylase gamma subunit